MKRFHEVKQSIVGVKIKRILFVHIQFQVNMMERSE